MSKYKDLTKEKLLEIVEQQDKELQDPKKYGLFWDKENVVENVVADCENNLPVLKRIGSREIKTDDSEDNILIEGDNYHALNVLNYTHRNKIDIIYIDPPYNTGNGDFKYNDKFIDKENGYRHSMWLNFMEKRLKLAKSLLSKTGVMFVSIDDNEQAQLRMLCAQIFGDDNFESMVWQKTDSRVDKNTNAKQINRTKRIHEYIFVIYMDKMATQLNKIMKLPEWKNSGKNPDKDPRGPYEAGIISFMEGHEKEDRNSDYYYSITLPSGRIVTRHFFVSKGDFDKLDADNRIYYPKDGDGIPRLKVFEFEEKEYHFESIIRGFGTSSSAKDEIEYLFGDRSLFDTPKPVKLIKEIIRSSTTRQSTVLDFMAGSGTTGHAVLDLNKEDGGNRKFILCTNNESNICTDVCHPRLKKVIKGYKNNKDEDVEGLGGNLKYFKTDFVKNTNNRDQLKINLTKKCTEILCVKENIFNLKKDQENYKIFTSNDGNRHLCIYYNFIDKDFDNFVKDISKLNGGKAVYIFALNNKIDKKEFKGIPDISFEAIPYKILEVYEQLVKISKK